MKVTIELLEAKRQEYAEAVGRYQALLQANSGALQATEELLAVARAPEPANTGKKE